MGGGAKGPKEVMTPTKPPDLGEDEPFTDTEDIELSGQKNCRGATVKELPSIIKDIAFRFRANLCILLETHVSGPKAENIIKKLGFESWCISETNGFVGGIWCLWKKSHWEIEPMHIHNQFIHMKVCYLQASTWWLTVVYGSPQPANKRTLWESLKRLAPNISEPSCLGRDFNSILSSNDTERNLWKDYEVISIQEESYWQQMSRCNIIQFGDKNTKYFHQKANGHRRRNRVTSLLDSHGSWIEDHVSLKNMGSLWVRVMKEKYGCENQSIPKILSKASSANAWRGITRIWNQFSINVIWRIGIGEKISFWNDHWVPDIGLLKNFAISPIDGNRRDEKVAVYARVEGDLDWFKLNQILPEEILELIQIIKSPHSDLGEDIIGWIPKPKGDFTIKFSYEVYFSNNENVDKIFRDIWKLNIP
ncbi:hypothetical protein Ahy_A03g010839 [Arachis hypogaea]|uniref:Reverse transcriptase zinc-binding domain-containing protein n=1 Tax=Arachis hypogaea TaxID=3818 RepID=A0A445DNP1_ARAHY|nr:hypothetical protein Ahy_A03g010839 [Arachis hypogaea]